MCRCCEQTLHDSHHVSAGEREAPRGPTRANLSCCSDCIQALRVVRIARGPMRWRRVPNLAADVGKLPRLQLLAVGQALPQPLIRQLGVALVELMLSLQDCVGPQLERLHAFPVEVVQQVIRSPILLPLEVEA